MFHIKNSEAKFPSRGCFQSITHPTGLTNHLLCLTFYCAPTGIRRFIHGHSGSVLETELPRITEFFEFCSHICQEETPKMLSPDLMTKGLRCSEHRWILVT